LRRVFRGMDSLVRTRPDVAYAVATMGLTSAAAVLVLELWRASLHAPFAYRDDSVLNLMVVKGVLENGWYLENPKLGAPLGQELYDFPVVSGDHVNVLLFKLLGLVSDEPAAVLNLFFLLTFPLVALTAFLVMRRLGITAGPALVCSALYSLLPYHFLRGETHIFLAAYYAVPLAAYLVLSVLTGESLFKRSTRTGLLAFASWTTLATIGICVVVASASGSFYYAGFAVILLAIATSLRFIVTRRAHVLVNGGSVAALILVFSSMNAAPTIVNDLKHGRNEAVGDRQPFESEYYSLRLTQLVLPLDSHRLEPFAGVRKTYDRWSASTGIDVTEAALAALGTIGALGFLGLLGVTLASMTARRPPPPLVGAAAVAAISAFLIATMGGFSSLFGMVYPQLRAWNRLSIFIAFFALVAVAVALDRARRLVLSRRRGRPLYAALLSIVLVLGVLDQTSQRWAPQYEETASVYARDGAFVRAIEQQLPVDAAVFELPYASFPEFVPPPPGRTVVYDLLRPYLHSERLRWSFGAMHGRPEDWASQLADKPLEQVVPTVSAVGFDAIYVDRLGYANDAVADKAERELVDILGRRPLRSEDGRMLFFDLRGYNERLRERLSARRLARLRESVLPGG
jgi:hypothetical protein